MERPLPMCAWNVYFPHLHVSVSIVILAFAVSLGWPRYAWWLCSANSGWACNRILNENSSVSTSSGRATLFMCVFFGCYRYMVSSSQVWKSKLYKLLPTLRVQRHCSSLCAPVLQINCSLPLQKTLQGDTVSPHLTTPPHPLLPKRIYCDAEAIARVWPNHWHPLETVHNYLSLWISVCPEHMTININMGNSSVVWHVCS